MTKQPKSPPRGPGNDGSWYLDLLGVHRRAQGTPASETTAEHVAGMWHAERRSDPLEDWAPQQLSRTVVTRRSFRWSVIALALLVGAVAAAAVFLVPRVAEQRIAERLAATRVALADARASLGPVQLALATATEPGSANEELAATAAALASATAAAAALADQSVKPLPDAPPIVGSADLDALELEQSRLSFMGAEAAAITSRVGMVVEYRLALDRILVLPALPTKASAQILNDLSVSLASALADSVTTAGSLPADAALVDHTRALKSAIDRFGDWQVEYLDALRRDREAEAAALVTEVATLRTDLGDLLVPSLAAIRLDVDSAILELATQLENSLFRLPG